MGFEVAGNSGKTVSNKVLDLRSLILWCKKRKYLTDDPLAEMGKFDTSPQTIRRAMTVNELRGLLDHCSSHRRLLYEVAFCTGLRENELRRLTPDLLDRDECAIRIPKHIDKGRKDRVQYIPAALMERLTAFVKAGEAKRIYARTYKQQGERVGKGLPKINFYPFRICPMTQRHFRPGGKGENADPNETPGLNW